MNMKTIDELCDKLLSDCQIAMDELRIDPKKYEIGSSIREHLAINHNALVNEDTNYFVSAHLNEMTSFTFHDIVDEIEDNFLIDYEFDIDRSNVGNGVHAYYWNHKTKDTFINIDFHPKSCNAVPTGKLIPETKRVCSW
jgi:hypothetical protein